MRRRWLPIALVAVGLVLGLITVSFSLRERAAPLPSPSAAVKPGSPAASSSAAKPRSERLTIVDVHVHLSGDGVSRLEKLMTQYGFDHVINLSGGTPLRGLQEQLAAAKSAPGKITVFTTLAYEQVQRPGYGKRMTELVRIAHSQGARGLKIAKALGLGLPTPDEKLMPVDDPGLDPVFEAAGELGMPVAIHSGDPKAFWLPVDKKNERYDELKAHPGWALHGEPVPSFDEILNQLERRIARHPKTNFISVHFGNCAEDPDRVARMLRRYPNMFIDTAARIPEMGRHPPGKMREFFIEFQDRILFGSDLGVGPEGTPLFLGSEGESPPTAKEQELFFSATHRYFETADKSFDHPTPIQGNWKISGIDLPRAVLEKVYSKNAIRLLKLDLPGK
jgi:predicted TIM-barrel fold metal-dependent hydrolase